MEEEIIEQKENSSSAFSVPKQEILQEPVAAPVTVPVPDHQAPSKAEPATAPVEVPSRQPESKTETIPAPEPAPENSKNSNNNNQASASNGKTQDQAKEKLNINNKSSTATSVVEFPEVNEKQLEVISCSIMEHGKWDNGSLYITEKSLIFINAVGAVKDTVMLKDITQMEKDKTNGFDMYVDSRLVVFGLFLSRDVAFDIVHALWDNAKNGFPNDGASVAASVRFAKETKFVTDTFPFAVGQVVLDHYACALNSNLQQGRMYITNGHNIFFHSSIPLYGEVKEAIPFGSITKIINVNSVLNNSIEVHTHEKMYIFKNFVAVREQCFHLLSTAYSKYTENRKFGASLRHTLHKEKREIPLIVEKAIEFLTQKGMNEEGLFRINASKTDVDRLKRMLDDGREVNFNDIKNSHVVAAILKLYCRELPEALLTADFYTCFMAVYQSKHLFPLDDLVRRLQDLMKMVPAEHRRITAYICKFLVHFASNESVNKMPAKNLAIIWGPIFFKSKDEDEAEQLTAALEIKELTTLILQHYDKIFAA